MPAVNIAALHGNKGTVNELLTSGANPNARRDPFSDYTPLHEAVMGSHSHVITNLLQMGANQFLCDVRGNNALHVACLNDDIECIRALLSDPNAAIIRRSLNAENRKCLKPHQVCSNAYCKLAVEHVMKGYNLAVCKPRVPLS
jgi:ankyrin repeat protein